MNFVFLSTYKPQLKWHSCRLYFLTTVELSRHLSPFQDEKLTHIVVPERLRELVIEICEYVRIKFRKKNSRLINLITVAQTSKVTARKRTYIGKQDALLSYLQWA